MGHVHSGIFLGRRLLPPSLGPFNLEIAEHTAQPVEFAGQPLALNLEVGRLLRDLELLRVQAQDLAGVRRRVVLREREVVRARQGLVLARELLQRRLQRRKMCGAEGAEGGKRIRDAVE